MSAAESPLDNDEPQTPAWFTFLGMGLFLFGGIFALVAQDEEEPAPEASAEKDAAANAPVAAAKAPTPAAAQQKRPPKLARRVPAPGDAPKPGRALPSGTAPKAAQRIAQPKRVQPAGGAKPAQPGARVGKPAARRPGIAPSAPKAAPKAPAAADPHAGHNH